MRKKILLRLYVIGLTEASKQTIRNLNELCKASFKDLYEIEVIDLKKNMQLAEDEKIFATPTLEKRLPLPVRRIIGDLSQKDKVLLGLDLINQKGE
jgi:circadian clock protein KaiB